MAGMPGGIVVPGAPPAAPGVTDHGALSGLGDDDHAQYLTNGRGDARYWALSTDLATQAELNASESGQVRDGDAAGGVLSGTYPNPGFAVDMATQAELDAAIAGVSGSSLSISVTQTGHGLSVGNAVRYNGTAYVKAQADSAANAEVVGIVSAVADANHFTLTSDGLVTGLSGLTAGESYFLSPSTAGALTATAPTTAGQVSKPVLLAVSTTAGFVRLLRGVLLTAPLGFDAFALVEDRKATATNGGTFTQGAWRTRDLNSELFDHGGIVTLPGSNRFQLLGGRSYFIHARAPGYGVARHVTRLVADPAGAATVVAYGSQEFATGNNYNDSVLQADVSPSVDTSYELQHFCETTTATYGFGVGDNSGAFTGHGAPAIYAQVRIARYIA